MNVVIPMAGAGSRFARAGFKKQKPFIDVGGKAMIVRVLENLACENARFFLIARREQLEEERDLVGQIQRDFDARFICIDALSEGTACTVLYAMKFIANTQPLLIANCDQIVDVRIGDFCADCLRRGLDGSILTFRDPQRNPKWSFVRLEGELVVQVREKEAISDLATVGIYFFARGELFVEGAIAMIIRNDRVNGEFYTCPVYNHAIKEGAKIGVFDIHPSQMHGLGTPEDLRDYLKFCSRKASL